jgi:hypothetical protein
LVIVPPPAKVTMPPLCAVVDVKLIITPVVDTVGKITLVAGVDVLVQPFIEKIKNKRNAGD